MVVDSMPSEIRWSIFLKVNDQPNLGRSARGLSLFRRLGANLRSRLVGWLAGWVMR